MILKGVDPFEQPSFSLGNRLARMAWAVVYHGLFRWTPPPLHGLRALLLRLFGARLGRGCHVYPGARIWAPWNLEMEDHASLANGVICYSMARVHVGKRAVVSQRAHLCTGTHDHEDPLFQLQAFPITIGDHAWICAEAFVGPGVEIGEGAVVGACSVVTRSMPAWMVCAGNPCRPLKPRRPRSVAVSAG